MKKQIYLSPPHMTGTELNAIRRVFASNWIAPIGPEVDAFEREFASAVGLRHAVALSSGTAALHLALRCLAIKRGDEVLCSTLTFVASANAILYEGGRPVFIDSDRTTWNMDPDLLVAELERLAFARRLPKAVVVVDLYGQCADLKPIKAACRRYGVPLIEDAAEALGATYRGVPAGSMGWANIFSFNGNKIITASSGGMLATNDRDLARRVRFLSQQAKDPAPHYEHSEVGYNYRMSNVLAAIGRRQLYSLTSRVAARRRNFERYWGLLREVPGLRFMPEPPSGKATRWLTCILIDPATFGGDREMVRRSLQRKGIESRPIWKPLHLQPLFERCRVVGGGVAEELFSTGLCLPSGSSLSSDDIRRVVQALLASRLTRSRK